MTPAPPEVVAQIVAEAEKRLKAGNLKLPDNETLLSQIGSASLPDISQVKKKKVFFFCFVFFQWNIFC